MPKKTGGKVKGPRAQLVSGGTLMLYGVVGDEWSGLTDLAVVEAIASLGDVDEIRVKINSPGGLVFHGLAIYNELRNHPAKIKVEITGIAASMGSVIAMAGDEIRIADNAHVMIHDPEMFAHGDAGDLREAADLLDRLGTSLEGIYSRRTGIPENEIREMMVAETWLTADEAVDRGFADDLMGASDATAFAALDVGAYMSAPAALLRQITGETNMPRRNGGPGATADANTADDAENVVTDPPAAAPAAPAAPAPAAPVDGPDNAEARVREAVARERDRAATIHDIANRHGLGEAWAIARVRAGDDLSTVRALALDSLEGNGTPRGPRLVPDGAGVTADEADKFRAGASAWLIHRAGQSNAVATATGERVDPGEFRGMSLLDLARESLTRQGVNTRGMSRREVAGAALGLTRATGAMVQTSSDFPILLENALHKMLLAAYGTAPDTWRRFCHVGTVSDFRPHSRLRMGSLSRLEKLLESGELRAKNIPDAEKEAIRANTFGNLVGITRQTIVNDDVDAFSRLIAALGRAAALSVEVDVYALLAENAGLGPTMNDGNPLFHNRGAGANNISAVVGAPSVATFDAARVTMATLRDPAGNEILDLRPYAWVGPIGLGGEARVVNDAEYDVDAVDADSPNKYMKPNKVRGLLTEVVDTPRLTGTRQYFFADPAVAPAIEVAFLEGQQAPMIEAEQGFEYDGIRWRVLYDYGVGGIDARGAVTQAGA